MDSFDNELYTKNRSSTSMLQHMPASEKKLTQEQRAKLRTYMNMNRNKETQLMHSSTLSHYPMFLENPILVDPNQDNYSSNNTVTDTISEKQESQTVLDESESISNHPSKKYHSEHNDKKISKKRTNLFEKLIIGLSFIVAVLSAVDSFIFG